MAHIWHGFYRETADDLTRCAEVRPKLAQGFSYLANLAYVHGLRGDIAQARHAMAAQCRLAPSNHPEKALAKFLKKQLGSRLNELPHDGTVGIMFGSYHQAVGHAILDPYHFYNLFRHRFDHLVVVHPPLAGYSRTTSLMVSILEQYIEQIDIDSAELAPFAWKNLGELPAGRFTFLCLNYWAMNRMMFHARQDPEHPLSRGRRQLALPAKLIERAEVICRRNRLNITQPIVVLHTRSHGYHRLRGQAYRNVDVRNYIPAVRRLLEMGYAVVRIGEQHMMSLRSEVPGLVELPLLDQYDPVLDPYFIDRCEFMISCQSGLCSLARALGKPNLVVNGVYHHTMLPECNELFLFKHYRDVAGNLMSVEEILARGCHLFDRHVHFEGAGVELEDATPAEILAATEEMVATYSHPQRADTPSQLAFRELMARFASQCSTHPLGSQMSDYIGYGLPEGRVSETCCQLRPGYVPVSRAARARAS
jgi:putative glycosyltransferase (TIGR04372 family)